MIKKIDPNTLENPHLHKFILGAVAPRPIAFASTVDADGLPNLSPFSFFNAFGVNPTTLIFSPSRRGRDNTTKHTYENVKQVPEVVINVVNYDMVQQASLASSEYPKGVNEFIKAGFTPLPSETIRPFRVKESPVQFECRVRDVIETGTGGGAANLVICEINMIHVHDDILDELGLPDQQKIRLVGRLGKNHYVKAFGESLFDVPKPVVETGIGIDRLPERIRLSKYLTGNHLGQLGNMKSLPSAKDVDKIKKHPVVKNLLISLKNDQINLEQELQLLGRKWIDDGRVADAFAVLMIDGDDIK